MSIVNLSSTLKSLDDGFRNKIETLTVCDDLRSGWAEDTVQDLNQLNMELEQVQRDLSQYRDMVARAKRDLASGKALMQKVQMLSACLAHIKTHLPAHVPQPGGESSQNNTKNVVHHPKENITSSTVNKASAVVGNKTTKIPTLTFITIEEFESVPKYIRGRLQYNQVNEAMEKVNCAVKAKYSLLRRPRNKLSQADMNIVRNCRMQENQETQGIYFVVDEDIKRWSNLRLDPCGRSLLTIMRTLKRLREIRGPGSIIRYALL